MSALLPACTTGVVFLSSTQSLSLGPPPVALDGSADFTLALWTRVPTADAWVATQGSAFALGFQGGCAAVRVGNTTVRTADALAEGRWYQLVAVCDIDAGLTLYVNGAPVATVPVTPATPVGDAPLILGDAGTEVAALRIAVWNSALDAVTVATARFADLPGDGATPSPTGAVDFARIPAVAYRDLSITWQGGAAQSVLTPGLSLSGAGAASGTVPAGLTDAFTIQGWVYVGAPVAWDNQGIWLWSAGSGLEAFGMQLVPDRGGTWSLMVASGRTGIGHSGLTLAGWHNFAVRGSLSGGNATVYLDGTLRTQGELAPFSATVPNTWSIGTTSNAGSGFVGVIQGMNVWAQQLTDGQITTNQAINGRYQCRPALVCSFTQGVARELVEGSVITLSGDATLSEPSTLAAGYSSEQLVAQARRPNAKLAELRPLILRRTNPDDYTPERAAELMANAERYLSRLDPAQAKGVRAQVQARLDRQMAAGRAGIPLGTFQTEQHGDQRVTFFYDEAGPRAVSVRPAEKKTDLCFDWMVDVTATGIFGILSILEVPVTPGIVSDVIEALLKKSKVWKAVAEVFAEEITAMTCVALVKALYDTDFLESFVDAILDDLSWWDFLWIAADVLIELAALAFPCLELTIVLAHLAVTVAQLGVLWYEKPSGCPAT